MDALAVEARGLSKRYTEFALEDVSFALPRGHVMGLIGPNGAGKTTTLKLLLGLLRRSGGEVSVLGADPELEEGAPRERIAFVHDEPFFYRWLTVAQNAALLGPLYPSWNAATFARLAAAFGLEPGKRFGALSRGNRTRFALAMALSHDAELIVMDEPTTGLDPVFRRELLDHLWELLQDERVSIVFSTHLTADLERIADFITLLQSGRVVFSVERDEILERWGVVKGGLELLDAGAGELLCGVQRSAFAFEGLTRDAAAARRALGEAAVVERATLDDVVVLMTTGGGGG
jgi:ABC-2 type transport system ATP-binding protein